MVSLCNGGSSIERFFSFIPQHGGLLLHAPLFYFCCCCCFLHHIKLSSSRKHSLTKCWRCFVLIFVVVIFAGFLEEMSRPHYARTFPPKLSISDSFDFFFVAYLCCLLPVSFFVFFFFDSHLSSRLFFHQQPTTSCR